MLSAPALAMRAVGPNRCHARLPAGTPGTRKMVMGIGFGFGMGNAFHASQRELRRLWGHSEERAA